MRRRHRPWLLAGALLVAAGCGSAPAGTPLATSAVVHSPASFPAPAPGGPAAPDAGPIEALDAGPASLLIRTSSLRLPTPTTRAVAFATASGLVVVGGLTPGGTTGRVVRIPVGGGASSVVGRLAHPVHDAGGALLHGAMLVLGGGASTQDAWVQRVAVDGPGAVQGRLPSPRADLAAVAAGSRIVVVGGGAAGRADARVLVTADGSRFTVAARLPVPVRYAAVVVVGSRVLVIGGASATGDTRVIQSVDLARGTAAVVGRLPESISHATVLLVGGVVVVAGGRHAGRALDSVLEVDPTSFAVRVAGRLPRAESDAAGVVADGVGYLVGGETDRPLATIVTIRAA
jgi:hypothetical protein